MLVLALIFLYLGYRFGPTFRSNIRRRKMQYGFEFYMCRSECWALPHFQLNDDLLAQQLQLVEGGGDLFGRLRPWQVLDSVAKMQVNRTPIAGSPPPSPSNSVPLGYDSRKCDSPGV
ncbi:hypothetical protein [Rhizobium leguminosarum]|uniref:hypothetical protein n=1 Tax=Rhizobium leguminosarum TaxID=384 RepID=UPI00056CAD10|nr:hypothetical protein [Rhizobium leguminosarum]